MAMPSLSWELLELLRSIDDLERVEKVGNCDGKADGRGRAGGSGKA